jgi:hypothetical protein
MGMYKMSRDRPINQPSRSMDDGSGTRAFVSSHQGAHRSMEHSCCQCGEDVASV